MEFGISPLHSFLHYFPVLPKFNFLIHFSPFKPLVSITEPILFYSRICSPQPATDHRLELDSPVLSSLHRGRATRKIHLPSQACRV